MYRKPAASISTSASRIARIEVLESRFVFAAPSFAPIADGLIVLAPGADHAAGAPLHIALNGMHPDGLPLTYSVTTDNPDLIAEIPTGNTSMKITVSYTDADGVAQTGDMIFQLFDDLAPMTTGRIKQLVDEGFYDGIIFHRIIENFMIQGGDPTGTGTSGSPLGEFDDEYHPDLQFTSSGLLAMAKTSDDTNNSQFFITAGPTRWLDFNHSIFGFLTEGEDVRAAVASVPTGSNNRPVNDVTMTSVTLFTDTENGVLRLKANPGTTGTSNVTVTATDEHGNEFARTFQVTIQADTQNTNPFLLPLPETINITQGSSVHLQLSAFDAENNPVEFQVNAGSTLLEFEVPSGTIVAQPVGGVGSLDVIIGSGDTPPGEYQIRFYVRPAGSGTTEESVIDGQWVTINILPQAPTSVVLDPAFDTGPHDDDGHTNIDTDLTFLVSGVEAGATVQLWVGEQIIGEATATAGNLNDGVLAVTTNPGFVFAPGAHSVTAIQKINGVESIHSAAIVVTVDNTPPVFISTPPAGAILAGIAQPNLYNVVTDKEATTGVVYELITKPDGMTINATTGLIAWHPQASQAGANQVVVRVTDKAGNTAEQSFNVQVQANSAPVIDQVADQSVDELQTLTLPIIADDVDIALGDAITYSLVGTVPPGAAIHPQTGVFTWTPAQIHANQTFSVTVRVTDSAGAFDEMTFQVTVNDVEHPPVLDPIDDQIVQAGNPLALQVTATDPDADSVLTYSLEPGAPDGMTIDAATGQISWITDSSVDYAEYTIGVRVTDNTDLFDTRTFTVVVAAAPSIAHIEDQTAPELSLLSVQVQATSPVPSAVLTYSLVDGPANAVINFQSGVFAFTPSEAQGPGQFSITVKVTDNLGLSSTQTFLVNVTEVNHPPVLDPISDQTIVRGETFELQITATDPDLPANVLTFSLETGAPEGMTIDPASGLLHWQVPHDQAPGSIVIHVTVTDEGDLAHTRSFTLAVLAPPIVDPIDNYVVDEHSNLSIAVTANSPHDPALALTYSLVDPPAGATIDSVTGQFNWTPSEAQGPGEYTIVVQVVDTNGLSATTSFEVIVNEVNSPPVIAPIAAQTPQPGLLFQLPVIATDPDLPANVLEFVLLDAPPGMMIDPATGHISWSVPNDLPPGIYNVTVQVSDEEGLTDSHTFALTVQSVPDLTTPDLDPNDGAIPGGGPGLPGSVEPSLANTNLASLGQLPAAATFNDAGNIDLVGSAGNRVVVGGYGGDPLPNDEGARMVGVVSDFQIGPDTGVGSQISPTAQTQRVRRPESGADDEHLDEDDTTQAPPERTRRQADRSEQQRHNAARPAETNDQQTSSEQHSEIDAAVSALGLSDGDIVLYQLMARQNGKALQLYSHAPASSSAPAPVSARDVSLRTANPGSAARAVAADSSSAAAQTGDQADRSASIAAPAIATAVASAAFMPMLVSDLRDEQDTKRRWWRKWW